MGMGPIEVIDRPSMMPNRALPLGKGSGGTFCLDNVAPTKYADAMGKVGVNGVLTVGFRMTAATPPVYIYVWRWHEASGRWWYAGSTVDKYRMTFDVDTGAYDGFYLKQNAIYTLTASEDLSGVYVGGENPIHP